MKLKEKIELLCLLIKTKEDKPFYRLHKREINLYIRVLKEDIDKKPTHPNNEKKKRRFKGLHTYILEIIHLITAYLNSS